MKQHKKKGIRCVEFADIDYSDAPDFCGAYITYAEDKDGNVYNDKELEELNDDRDLVYQLLMDYLY